MSWTPQMRWLDADGKPQRAFPELKLRFRFNHEAGARLFENAATGFAEIMAAADAGEPQGFGLPGMLTLSATTGLRRTESTNVLGLLPGADPNLRNEIIVVTAHLDHLGRGSAVERRFDLQRRARQCRRYRNPAGDGARAARIEHETAALGVVRGRHRRGKRPARLRLLRAASRRRGPAHRRQHQYRHADAVRAGARFRGDRRRALEPRRDWRATRPPRRAIG